MPRAQIFTLQSAEPLKINLSLSDRDRDQAGGSANTHKQAGEDSEGRNRVEKKKERRGQSRLSWEEAVNDR